MSDWPTMGSSYGAGFGGTPAGGPSLPTHDVEGSDSSTSDTVVSLYTEYSGDFSGASSDESTSGWTTEAERLMGFGVGTTDDTSVSGDGSAVSGMGYGLGGPFTWGGDDVGVSGTGTVTEAERLRGFGVGLEDEEGTVFLRDDGTDYSELAEALGFGTGGDDDDTVYVEMVRPGNALGSGFEVADLKPLTPSGPYTYDGRFENIDDLLNKEIGAAQDGTSWPIINLDETTIVSNLECWLWASDKADITSTKFSNCIDEDMFISKEGWCKIPFPQTNPRNIETMTALFPTYGTWALQATGSIALWTTVTLNTYTDPDGSLTGVRKGMWNAALTGHAFGHEPTEFFAPHPCPDLDYGSGDPYANYLLFAPYHNGSDYGRYNVHEASNLHETFGFTALADGHPYEETYLRLQDTLDLILDGLEEGYVPRNDIIRTVPRLRLSDDRFQKITQMEIKEDVTIAKLIPAMSTAQLRNNRSAIGKLALLNAEGVKLAAEKGDLKALFVKDGLGTTKSWTPYVSDYTTPGVPSLDGLVPGATTLFGGGTAGETMTVGTDSIVGIFADIMGAGGGVLPGSSAGGEGLGAGSEVSGLGGGGGGAGSGLGGGGGGGLGGSGGGATAPGAVGSAFGGGGGGSGGGGGGFGSGGGGYL